MQDSTTAFTSGTRSSASTTSTWMAERLGEGLLVDAFGGTPGEPDKVFGAPVANRHERGVVGMGNSKLMMG